MILDQVSIPSNLLLYIWLKWPLFILNIKKKKKITLFSPRVPTNYLAGKCILIFYTVYVNGVLGPGGTVPYSQKCSPKTSNFYNYSIRKLIDRN